MSETRHTKVLIIGSGPAGYTAGVYASRAMLEPILVQGIEPGGQLTTTTEVENWPGDTEVQGPDLMIRMEAHAKAMGCEIIGDISKITAYDGRINMKDWTKTIACNNHCCLVRKESPG